MPARELPSQDIFIIYLSVHFSGSIRLSSEFTQQYATQHLGSGVYALYPPDTDKAQGLMKLMEHYNVGPQSVGYLGYDESDAMALMYCECSVTVVPSPTMLPSNTSKRASHGPYMSDTPLFSKYIIQEGFDYPTFAAAMKHIFGDTATPLDPSGTQHKA
ncbi:haloacid dehalogenase-like hydrolase family member protein [Babesia caballi]|uniref:Haloacid dehalogenase-like hydrolase family member protein n=1 Tax=Babesia caballi TaxID=5871 RepID=A0AAV4LYX6_BABCB|nr:haloacid dehalogenase-like hydrolase family member protein [Babesia caballi]